MQLGQVGVDTKNLLIETSAAERNEKDRENLQLDANARRWKKTENIQDIKGKTDLYKLADADGSQFQVWMTPKTAKSDQSGQIPYM